MLKKKLGVEAVEMDWPDDVEELKDYYKVPTTIIIPPGCERIGDFAFWECEKVKEVIIPKGVEEIGYKAFFECTELEEVEIPEGVRNVGKSAFEKCRILKEVEIPESVEVISQFAFWGCVKATIILKNSGKDFKIIGIDAFLNCKDVKDGAGIFRKIRKTLEIWWKDILKKVSRSRD